MRRGSSVFALVLATLAPACGNQDATTPPVSTKTPPHSGGNDVAGDDSSSEAGAGPRSSGSPLATGDDAGSSPVSGDDAGDDASPPAPDGGDAAPPAPDAAPTRVKGQGTPDEVVMLGDSYLDPAWGNVGPTLMTDASAMYRH